MSWSIPNLLVGLVAGLVLGEIIRFVRVWVTTQRQARLIRAALYPEIQGNLDQLDALWDKLRPRKDADEIHRVDKVGYAREFAQTELPPFSRRVYEAQLALLPTYIGRRQFAQLARFYASLARLEQTHAELRAAREQDIAGRTMVTAGPGLYLPVSVTYDLFLRTAARSWDDVHHTIEQMLDEGNPLDRPHSRGAQ